MKVAVIGAGPSGLTTIKQLRDEGHEVVCFDKNGGAGGIWYRDDVDQDNPGQDNPGQDVAGQDVAGTDHHQTTKAYDSLYLTISMKMMAFSDYPYQGPQRVFYTRSQYLEYLREYADRFGILECIRSSSEVTDLTRTKSGWTVTARTSGTETREDFDAIALCSGPFQTPNRDIPGLENFTGEIIHSGEYRDAERFRGKRVLIVGLAESGADLVREVGEVAQACTLSIRSYTWLLPRVFNSTKSTDNGTVRSHVHEMLRRSSEYPFVYESFWGRSAVAKFLFLAASVVYGVATTVAAVVRKLLGKEFAQPKLNPFGAPADPPMLDLNTPHTDENWEMIRTWNHRSQPDGSWCQRSIFSKNVTFIPSLVNGQVVLNDAGIDGSDGATVRFKDGTTHDYDAVVLCTGYRRTEQFLGDLTVKDANVRNLYKHFLHPEHAGTAAVIGLTRPFSGGVPICAEMQARYFARVLSGKLSVPKDLDRRIAAEKAWEEHFTALSPRHTEAIPSQVIYLDELAREIGCLLPWWKLVLNPKLFIQVWFGSFNQSCYRIVGPHNLGKAAVDDLYSEPVENRRFVAWDMSVLQCAPKRMHPRDIM
ncbi:NAD(P)-binding protein [Gordonia pseudamarae]|uniref:NAD(P)-binding protein n=1 Tax=Gordonia pseudamarae TaxID=2831662 RepID=A0ABX6IEW8_9ACTN|nr:MULTISPECIES: NAD(P)-binding domain-containing protein [Gordonia]MBD0022858.1 NAD(P)-binding domain-containing protein [Gordonia sp. (in: high G+C Gram-positive bacteria)]QHN24725.1 NAD(P)-binding protein [Gordonia pseudamarae]QHN33656.1 NAD(P)-binding protein [Gordonia pseudamarae]